ncbi:GFA family protein [Flavisphingomonas formosensis]|uniref:GFA family protein n=1 Tax=Flavisphingomonas formosensis TaxID=861534 RepID=UPI0012F74A04|nr:GFA family protein [Sphingomonas formosensis]
MSDRMTGGCQCGAVRYSVGIADDDAYLCHCRMCQRAAGNVSIAFKTVPRADVVWDGEPGWYASSPIAKRPFCSRCGTPLGFAYDDSETMDLNVATFDDPRRFVPRHHFGIETRLDQWLDTSALPGYRLEDSPATVERWMKAIGKLPD